jgi:hypothetical protein
MSNLRSDFEAAQRQYAALHYPGDLAAHVLPARSRRAAWVAAAVVFVALSGWLLNHRTAETHIARSPAPIPPEPPAVVQVEPDPEPQTETIFLACHVELRPEPQSLLAPLVPTLWDSGEVPNRMENPTTKESL